MTRDSVWTVYMLAPVNVQVRARSADEAKGRAFRAVNPPGKGGRNPQAVNTDDSEAMFLDDGQEWQFDPNHVDPVRHDSEAYFNVVNPKEVA